MNKTWYWIIIQVFNWMKLLKITVRRDLALPVNFVWLTNRWAFKNCFSIDSQIKKQFSSLFRRESDLKWVSRIIYFQKKKMIRMNEEKKKTITIFLFVFWRKFYINLSINTAAVQDHICYISLWIKKKA